MSQHDPDKASVTFCDVVACFSEEEWKLLHEWQQELYKNVMKEIQQAFISLGPVLATNIFSLRVKGKEDLCNEDKQYPDRDQHMDRCAKYQSLDSDNVLTIEQTLQGRFMDDHASGVGETNNGHISSGHEAEISMFSSKVKEETKIYPIAGRNTRPSAPSSTAGLSSFAAESEESFMEGVEGSTIVNADSSNVLPITGHPFGSLHIKDEENACSAGWEDSASNKSISNPTDASTSVNSNIEHQRSLWETQATNRATRRSLSHDVIDHQQIKPTETLFACTEYGSSSNPRLKPTKLKMSHTEETPYTCTEYEDNITESASPSTHQNIPTVFGLHICSHCGNCFKQLENNITHQQNNNGEQNSICSECEKNMHQSAKRYSEPEKYPGERPYKCSECGKFFRKSQTLMVHKRVHTGEKPFPCGKCGKNFRQLPHLVKHQRMHMGEKPYVCNLCEWRFIDSSHLKRHQQIHTRVTSIRNPRRLGTSNWPVEG